jgi:alkanesulfonate monooxygenase SsuD/methylene tetrahydromethanopterin reductase-like flavin-dependent oxidoreductase (luciferase family)
MPTTLPPPNRAFEKEILPFGGVPVEEVTSIAMVGSPATVLEGVRRFSALTAPDELIVVSHIYDHGARVRSFEIAAEAGAALV